MWSLSYYFWVALLSLAVGSFLGALVARFGKDPSVVAGRSKCPHCGRTLSLRDLVPILSWIALKARCRSCNVRISSLYPFVELGSLMVGLSAAMIHNDSHLILALLLGWALLLLAGLDWLYFTLPLPLTIGLAVAGLLTAPFTLVGSYWVASISWAIGFIFLELIRRAYLRIRARHGLGQGDSWLFAASGTWVGWQHLPWVLFFSTMLALAWYGLKMAVQKSPWDGAQRLPLGSWLAISTWIVYVSVVWKVQHQ